MRYNTIKLVTTSSMSAAQQLAIQKQEIELIELGFYKHGKRVEKPVGLDLTYSQLFRQPR